MEREHNKINGQESTLSRNEAEHGSVNLSNAKTVSQHDRGKPIAPTDMFIHNAEHICRCAHTTIQVMTI